jgi:hypothetical protein
VELRRDPGRSALHVQGKVHRIERLSRRCAVSRGGSSSDTSDKTEGWSAGVQGEANHAIGSSFFVPSTRLRTTLNLDSQLV